MLRINRYKIDIRLILLLGMLASCGPLAVDMYLPSLPSIAHYFSVKQSYAQYTLTGFMSGFSIGILLYGPLSDALGRRPVLLSGIALFTIASFLCFSAGSISTLIFARFIQAIGAGASSVLTRTIARDTHEPENAAKVLLMVGGVTSIGPLFAPLIGSHIIRFYNWRAVFAILTLFGSLCMIVAFFYVPETWPKHRRISTVLLRSFISYRHILSNRSVWGYILCGGMAFASMFSYITASPFVYIEYFHISPQHYAMLFGLNIFCTISGNFLNAWLITRISSLKIISVAALFSSIGSLGVSFFALTGIGNLWSIVFALFFVISIVGVLSVNCTTNLMIRYPNNAGAAAAIFGAVQLGLGALVSSVIGALTNGTPSAMGITIGISGLLCLVGRQLILRENKIVIKDSF
ncbi:MAG: Bcr/CflA family multidrug efflux MFS transporter [Burkholderia sp.]|nr:Bcr/CflA family multidrug efflux MFS transporter [Burkholderia sp.]